MESGNNNYETGNVVPTNYDFTDPALASAIGGNAGEITAPGTAPEGAADEQPGTNPHETAAAAHETQEITDSAAEASQRFPYSAENPPPLEELRTRMFAVHATQFVPQGNKLKALARDISYGQKWGEDVPSFRPTIHFALGGLVSAHGDHTWDDSPYAVVSPLSNLEPHLVNVMAHDTIAIGAVPLNESGTAVLAPEDADMTGIGYDVQVIRYDRHQNVSEAVKAYIQQQGGWEVSSRFGDVHHSAHATIDGTNINSEQFFGALLEAHPDLSFGGHAHSLRGESYRYGVADLSLNNAIMRYETGGFDPLGAAFEASLAAHHIAKIEQNMAARETLPPGAMLDFQDKKHRAIGWLNFVDADLWAGGQFGKSLAYAPKGITAEAMRLRHDPAALRAFITEHIEDLPYQQPPEPLYYARTSDQLSSMPPAELDEFITARPGLFNHVDIPALKATYAAVRQYVLGPRVADEQLDTTLDTALQEITDPTVQTEVAEAIMSHAEETMDLVPEHMPQVLQTLNNARLRKWLGITNPERPIADLGDLMHRHPATMGYDMPEMALTEQEEKMQSVLKTLRYVRQRDHDTVRPAEPITRFSDAKTLMRNRRAVARNFSELAAGVTAPIREKAQEIIPLGATLSTIHLMQRDYEDATAIWSALGLADAYRAAFPNDDDFWNSDESFMDIYERLSQPPTTTTAE